MSELEMSSIDCIARISVPTDGHESEGTGFYAWTYLPEDEKPEKFEIRNSEFKRMNFTFDRIYG